MMGTGGKGKRENSRSRRQNMHCEAGERGKGGKGNGMMRVEIKKGVTVKEIVQERKHRGPKAR
jgi:hypothetical protein